MTPEQQRARNRGYQAKYLAKMTPEELKAYNHRLNENARKRYANLSPEEKREYIDNVNRRRKENKEHYKEYFKANRSKTRSNLRKWLNNLPPEKKEELKKKHTERTRADHRKIRANELGISVEEFIIQYGRHEDAIEKREEKRLYQQEYYANMSPEKKKERAEDARKRRLKKKNEKLSLTPKEEKVEERRPYQKGELGNWKTRNYTTNGLGMSRKDREAPMLDKIAEAKKDPVLRKEPVYNPF